MSERAWNRERLQALRRAVNVSQAGLARLVGVGVSTVAGWERERRNPTEASADRLLEIESFPVEYRQESVPTGRKRQRFSGWSRRQLIERIVALEYALEVLAGNGEAEDDE
jgi:transcriptional regulator with XRE-family HTH domain